MSNEQVFPNEITIKVYKAGEIQEGQEYGYVAAHGVMASTLTITSVKDGIASCVKSHWGESWIVKFDAKTGAGIDDFIGTQLISLI